MPEALNKKIDKTLSPADVINAEREYLNLDAQKTVSGIAVSGGGIRSASFGLGVMQALVANNQLQRMDYMSTVSGGGYLGAALTWALKQGGTSAGTTSENFPLGKRGKHRDKDTILKDNPVDEDDNKLLDFIRQHGSYLAPTPGLDMVSFVAVVLRSMVMSLFVYFSFLTIAMTTSLWLLYKLVNFVWPYATPYISNVKFLNPLENNGEVPENLKDGAMLFIGAVLLIYIVLKGFIFSIKTYASSNKAVKKRYINFIKGQELIGFLLKISLACFVLGSLPYFTSLMGNVAKYIIPSGSTLFGSVVGLWQYKKAQSKEHNSGGVTSDLMIYAGAIALFYGVLLFAYMAATELFLGDNLVMEQPFLFGLLVIVSFLFGRFVNLNVLGPHHIWRNRLMEAFMPNKHAVETNCWEPATEADAALMEDMCDENNRRPYHIINTNVILANSPKVDYSGRGGDNFIISRLFCGCDATGWKATRLFQKNKTRGMTLATAMATSAAALNPGAAVSGEGVTRNVVISILLSMLNLRLGYWAGNPAQENTLGAPNFFVPGLTSEILRKGLKETSQHIQLSDGGHYENLALYELIRRKLNLIIVSDGGADPVFNFDDLANAIEKVRVDFGVKISFNPGYELGNILPGTAGDSFFQKKYGIAKAGFAIGKIKYADNSVGTLVYVKLAMIEDMATDVFSYKGVNPSFPHQSTSDQFFDEKQFEAYRELGYYIAWQMMSSEDGKKIFPNDNPS